MAKPGDTIEAQIALCARSPRITGAWVVLARRFLDANRPGEAAAAAARALALEPRNTAARAVRRSAIMVLDAQPKALSILQLKSALEPDNIEAHVELGYAYAERDRFTDAERHFKRALPQTAAHAALGALYLRVGIMDGAEHHARLALEAEAGQPVASETLSVILAGRGETVASQTLLNEAYSRNSLFAEPTQDSPFTVLVLATQTSGNIPYRHLMPSTLYSRLIWYMEHAKPDQALPAYDVVFNIVGDPDLSLGAQEPISQFLPRNTRPVLNAPDKVARTFRHLIPALFGGLEGIVVPATVRLPKEDIAALGLAEAATRAGLAPPLLVRPTGSHGGRKLVRADDLDALGALDAEFQDEDVYLTCYHDYRSADGLYRKGRMIFVDRKPYPYHWAIATDWLVHYDTARMEGQADRQAEERLYLTAPEALIGDGALAAIAKIGQAIDLDYGGLDFSILADGRVLVFETNATMFVHPEDPAGEFAYKNPAVDRIIAAFRQRLGEAAS